ncbi:MAG: ABC transporter permease subunit [Sandaracinaceae bacterium]|nr:ABC transporter permease subunit [Sandaracinaceae bacterium]
MGKNDRKEKAATGQIRDLGYRGYEGDRLPASHNTYVLLRHGLSRAWASWFVRIWALVGLLVPAPIGFAYGFLASGLNVPDDPAVFLQAYFTVQTWLVVSIIALRVGATVIAEDRTHRAFQFFLAKPVTATQYMAGRAIAIAISIWAVFFIPSMIVVGLYGVVKSGTPDQGPIIGMATLASLGYSAIAAIAIATISIGVSAISRSRALTMTSWVGIFVVPHVLALLVQAITRQDWLYLASIPGALSVVRDALFGVEITSEDVHLRWFHAAPVLALLCAGAGYLVVRRIRGVEVIT